MLKAIRGDDILLMLGKVLKPFHEALCNKVLVDKSHTFLILFGLAALCFVNRQGLTVVAGFPVVFVFEKLNWGLGEG